MEIKITERHLELEKDVKTLASKKAKNLGKFDPGIHSIEVIFTKEKIKNKAEVLVKSRHYTLEATSLNEDIRASLDEVMAKIERRLRQQREKVIDKKHRKSAAAPAEAEEAEDAEEAEE